MMPRICAALPCSAAHARQIHHPKPRRVVSWGLGGYSSNTGGSLWKEDDTPWHHHLPIHCTHSTAHTHIRRNTRLLKLRSCTSTMQTSYDSWTESERPTTLEHIQSSLQEHIKTCCTIYHRKPVPCLTIMIVLQKKKRKKCVLPDNQNNPHAAHP